MNGAAGRCEPIRAEFGVYLLGAISPGDRDRVGQHLGSCSRCRDELAGLAGLPGLLAGVPPAEAAAAWADDPAGPAPGPALDALIRSVSRSRGHRRLAAVLAGVFLAGLAAVTALQASSAPAAAPAAVSSPRWTGQVSGSSAVTGAWAAVRYAAQPWGSELEVQVADIPSGTRCQLVVTGPRGQDTDAGGWAIAPGSPPAWYPGSVPLPPASLRRFAVTCGGKTLVSLRARMAG